ncbi:MAG: ABC transporter permease [Acidimicrobiales bacterium]
MTSTAGLIRREAGYARKTLVRDPQNLFFTVGLPLLYLFIFASIFGDQEGAVPGQPGLLNVSTIMTASVIAIGVTSAAFQNLVIALVQDRENGVLKRLRSTPVSTAVFLGGHVLNAVAFSMLLSIGVALLGVVVYGVDFPGTRILPAIVSVVIGSLALAAAAFPFTRLIKKGTGATPMAVAITLTLFFLSGNFFPDADMPQAIVVIADLFPVRQLYQCLLTAFNPNTTGSGFLWDRLAVLGAWAVGGTVVGLRFFRWTPTADT